LKWEYEEENEFLIFAFILFLSGSLLFLKSKPVIMRFGFPVQELISIF